MMKFLEKILETKRQEITAYQKIFHRIPSPSERPRQSLYKALKSGDHVTILSEIKRGSPSKGLFAPKLDISDKVSQYLSSGAGALSVLTDREYFHGSFGDLQQVSGLAGIPVLCKDFIIDSIQIDLAAHYGADVILLIASALEWDVLLDLRAYAMACGLEVLIEVHDETEMQRVLASGHRLIGINNRNLRTFETDLDISLSLIDLVKDPAVACISESGIGSIEDVRMLAKAGFDGMLIGESLVRRDTHGEMLRAFSSVTRCIA